MGSLPFHIEQFGLHLIYNQEPPTDARKQTDAEVCFINGWIGRDGVQSRGDRLETAGERAGGHPATPHSLQARARWSIHRVAAALQGGFSACQGSYSLSP